MEMENIEPGNQMTTKQPVGASAGDDRGKPTRECDWKSTHPSSNCRVVSPRPRHIPISIPESRSFLLHFVSAGIKSAKESTKHERCAHAGRASLGTHGISRQVALSPNAQAFRAVVIGARKNPARATAAVASPCALEKATEATVLGRNTSCWQA